MVRYWIFVFALITIGIQSLQAAERRALLELRINDAKKGAINVIVRNDDVLARVSDLDINGLVTIGGRSITVQETKYVSLNSLLPTIKYLLNEIDLSLRLTVILAPTSIPLGVTGHPKPAGETSLLPERTAAATSSNDTLAREAPPTALASPAPKPRKEQLAILALTVNSLRKDELSVILRANDVLAKAQDLAAAGLVGFEGKQETIDKDRWVSLKSLEPNVAYKVDEGDLSLNLTVQPLLLGNKLIDFQQDRPPNIEYREDTSGFVNYAVNVQNFKSFSAFAESGINFKNNLFYSSVIRNDDGTLVRGLSNLTISDRKDLQRTIVGDRAVATDVLGGSLIFGGISYFREFGLDPYFTRSPGLHYSGAVSTPSSLDVYVNGQFLRRVQLPPGQFELKDLPVPTGSADTRLVLRDAFGREQEFLAPFYFTAGLIKKGLHEYSYNLGVERPNLSTESWHYGTPVFLGRHRFGFTDGLTAGFRLEATPKLVSGGPSLSLLFPFGELDLLGAWSIDGGHTGAAGYLGYNYTGPLFSFGTSVRYLTPEYATTSLRSLDKRPQLQTAVSVSFSVADRTGVSLRYSLEDSKAQGSVHRFVASTSTPIFKGLNLFLRGAVSKEQGKNSFDILSGLTFSFGDYLATASYDHTPEGGSGVVSLQKNPPLGSGFGYRLLGRTGNTGYSTDSQMEYQGLYGRYDAYHAYQAGQHSSQLNAAGGLVYVGGDFMLTRPLQDGFALLRIPGLKGIRGYINNLEIGQSDRKGNILVPNLLPYYGNRLSISDKDIPLNYNIEAVEFVIAPPYRGGAVVTFPVTKVQRAIGTVVIEDKEAVTIPTHGQLTITSADGKSFDSPIGRKGEFYLENIPSGRHNAIVVHEDRSCEFQLTVPKSEDTEIKVGDLRCRLR